MMMSGCRICGESLCKIFLLEGVKYPTSGNWITVVLVLCKICACECTHCIAESLEKLPNCQTKI